ncbi:MAG TPA: cation-translocating P-type ATPase, partial [Pirellulales bacterium]
PRRESDLLAALTVGARCNHAMVVRTADENGWTAIGDPTEAALVVAAKKAGIPAGPHGLEVVAELPFDSDRKAMSLVTRDERGRCTVFTKGAPEVVLAGCSRVRWQGQEIELNAALRAEIAEAAAEMASRALRVIALAYRDEVAPHADGDYENDLVFAGLAGLIDPPRDEARTAVARCRAAGIRPIMITGDHPATALAIAKELGIAGEHDRNVTGRDLEEMSDEALSATVDSVAVYARVTAEHKLRIVKSLHARGQIVAMTGDGVNDAPAVKAADIGVAMGVAGTDVTKEASAMVLTDDNFASIVNAVEEGRGIYDNIKKFVAYLLAGNAGKLLVMFLAVVFGWPVPLLAVQILWLNLVTDGLAALALGVEPPEPGVMKRKPRRPSDPILSASDAYRIVAHGALAAGAALLGFWLVWQGDSAKLAEGQVVAFCILGFSQLLYALACRSETATVWALGFTTNRALLLAIAGSAALQSAVVVLPFLHSTFGVEAYPTPFEWLLIVLLSLVPALVVESLKLTRGRSADEGIAPSRDGLSLG